MFFFVLCTFDSLIFLHGRGFDPAERIDLYCGTGADSSQRFRLCRSPS